MKETRKSLYDSESGVKKMAVGHHLGVKETCSQGRGSRGRTLSTWMKVGEIGSGTSVECRFGCGDYRGEWVWDQRVGWVFDS